MSADGQMPDATPAPVAEAPQTEAPQVNDALLSRLDEMSQQIQSLSNTQPAPDENQWNGGIGDLPYMDDQQAQQPFEKQQPGFDEYAQDPYGQQDPYAQQPQVDPMQQLEQMINQRVEAVTGPVLTQYQQMVQNQKAQALEAKYPQLADPKVVGPLMDHVVRQAQRIGQPEQARNPDFIEMAFLAQQATASASQETPADGGQGVHLESGGAAPQQEEVDPATRMLQAWNKA